VAGLEHLVRAGVPTVIAFTAHRGNYREFPQVAALGRQLGVARVWADRLIPWGNGSAMHDQLLTADETREFVLLITRARAEGGRRRSGLFGRAGAHTEIAGNRALQFLGCGGQPYHCSAGDRLVALLPDGDLTPCRRMPLRVGNVLQTPLEALYRCELFRTLRDRSRVSAGCAGCLYARLCGGGLHCLAHAVTGDPFRADPGCWLAREEPTDPGQAPK
jgi:radical SAM protein with 4Fe4S-binding SPASM domain